MKLPLPPKRISIVEIDQLEDLVRIAHKFGFYDAADFIKNKLK